jgi:hypothetical protein
MDATETLACLRALLEYDPDTGEFVWRAGRNAGKPAGSLDKINGYWIIRAGGRYYRRGRLAWLFSHGEWPVEADHRDRVKTNDRLANLRNTDRHGNCINRGFANDSKRLTGVTMEGPTGFHSSITVRGQRRYLGFFKTAEAAHQAYLTAKASALASLDK